MTPTTQNSFDSMISPFSQGILVGVFSTTVLFAAYQAFQYLQSAYQKQIEAHFNDYLADRLITLLTPNHELDDNQLQEKARSIAIRNAFIETFSDPTTLDELCTSYQLSPEHAQTLKTQRVAFKNLLQPSFDICSFLHNFFTKKKNPHKGKVDLSLIDQFILKKLIEGYILKTKPDKTIKDIQKLEKASKHTQEIAKKVTDHLSAKANLSSSLKMKLKSLLVSFFFIDEEETSAVKT